MKGRFFPRFRKAFITGLLIILPMVVTIFILKVIFVQLNSRFTPLFKKTLELLHFPYIDTPVFNFVAPLASIILIIIFISLLGVFATHYIGKKLVIKLDEIMLRIPLVKGIYGAAKQLLDAIQAPGSKSFQKVVFVEYPRKGVYVIGFLGTKVKGDISSLPGKKFYNVFVPTTPNPTSGFLLLVPEDELFHVNMPIEAALKYIVSGGLVADPFNIVGNPTSQNHPAGID